MKKRITLLGALIASATLGAFAQAVTVSFVDGQAMQGSGSTWKKLAEGDAVDPAASVKIATGGYLELRSGGATLSLSQPGTYALREILASGRASRTGAAQAALSKYISALSAKGTANASTVAGVRGAEQGKDEGADWVSNDTDVYLSAAKDYIASGDYAAAEEQLAKAQDKATDEKNEVEFYLAEAAALRGDARAAHQRLATLKITGSESWAPDYELLKARLLVDSFAPQAAVELLLADQARLSTDSGRAPLYYFILAIAYKDLGEKAKSKDCAGRLKSIAGDSELAKAAQTLDQ
jgi:hypothetical protein